jgi:hypothetical protein
MNNLATKLEGPFGCSNDEVIKLLEQEIQSNFVPYEVLVYQDRTKIDPISDHLPLVTNVIIQPFPNGAQPLFHERGTLLVDSEGRAYTYSIDRPSGTEPFNSLYVARVMGRVDTENASGEQFWARNDGHFMVRERDAYLHMGRIVRHADKTKRHRYSPINLGGRYMAPSLDDTLDVFRWTDVSGDGEDPFLRRVFDYMIERTPEAERRVAASKVA